jgi:hypothetical protein
MTVRTEFSMAHHQYQISFRRGETVYQELVGDEEPSLDDVCRYADTALAAINKHDDEMNGLGDGA